MINDFVVQAQKENNQLYVLLDGIFMKSEIDLTLYLVKREILKLKPGFKALIDIQNLDTGNFKIEIDFNKYKKMLRLMGAKSVRFMGLSSLFIQNQYQNGGDYSFENEWYF
jgi:hypothetical protein